MAAPSIPNTPMPAPAALPGTGGPTPSILWTEVRGCEQLAGHGQEASAAGGEPEPGWPPVEQRPDSGLQPGQALAAGVNLPLPVSGVGPVSGVTFSVDGTTCSTVQNATTDGIDYPYMDSLVGTLTGPDGTKVSLFDHAGGYGFNMCQAVFTDSAGRSIQGTSAADAPYTGSWRPVSPLSAFAGKQGDGTWQLNVASTNPYFSGYARAVSLHVTGYAG